MALVKSVIVLMLCCIAVDGRRVAAATAGGAGGAGEPAVQGVGPARHLPLLTLHRFQARCSKPRAPQITKEP